MSQVIARQVSSDNMSIVRCRVTNIASVILLSNKIRENDKGTGIGMKPENKIIFREKGLRL